MQLRKKLDLAQKLLILAETLAKKFLLAVNTLAPKGVTRATVIW